MKAANFNAEKMRKEVNAEIFSVTSAISFSLRLKKKCFAILLTF